MSEGFEDRVLERKHRRQVAERIAADLASFVLQEIETLDQDVFWRKFDECTNRRPAAPAEPAPPTVSRNMTGERDVDALLAEIYELAEAVPDRGREYAESVLETARSIADTVEDRGQITVRQMNALSNLRDGLQRWQR